MRKDWTLIRAIRGGHKYWGRNADGAIGISDGSGTYPENCEPGERPPLLLDTKRPVTLGAHPVVPLTDARGEPSSTPVGAFEALWVATTFDMKIEALEKGASIPCRFTVQAMKPFT